MVGCELLELKELDGLELEELLDDELEELDGLELDGLEELLDEELDELEELLELFAGSESAGWELVGSEFDELFEELFEELLESTGSESELLEELFVDSLSSELLSTEDEELSADELDEPFSGVSLFPAQAAKVAEISAHNITTVKNLFINSPLDCFFSIVIRFVKR